MSEEAVRKAGALRFEFLGSAKNWLPAGHGKPRQGKRGWTLPVEAAKSKLSANGESKMGIPANIGEPGWHAAHT